MSTSTKPCSTRPPPCLAHPLGPPRCFVGLECPVASPTPPILGLVASLVVPLGPVAHFAASLGLPTHLVVLLGLATHPHILLHWALQHILLLHLALQHALHHALFWQWPTVYCPHHDWPQSDSPLLHGLHPTNLIHTPPPSLTPSPFVIAKLCSTLQAQTMFRFQGCLVQTQSQRCKHCNLELVCHDFNKCNHNMRSSSSTQPLHLRQPSLASKRISPQSWKRRLPKILSSRWTCWMNTLE